MRPIRLSPAVVTLLLVGLTPVRAGDSPAKPAATARSVAQIEAAHDRALVRDLTAYVEKNPKADDVDQAYMALFDKVIEHDWFTDHEAVAARYLSERPDGPVRSLARIVGTMARAQAGDFSQAIARFQELMKTLGKTEQEEFAVNFTDSLASSAVAVGEYAVARQAYQALLDRFGENPDLRQKVKGDLARLDLVGKPAPDFTAADVDGKPVRLDQFRGKYLLIDFWATWCAPCVAELPRVQAAYQKYHAKGLEVLAVSLDDTKSAATDYVKARKIPWRQVHNASAGFDLVEAFGVHSIPATFLVDPKGNVVRLELRGTALDAALAQLLGGPAAP
ncbi:MAG: TlpA disulfide reductase family protein [Isosphaeraceae bacterium]